MRDIDAVAFGEGEIGDRIAAIRGGFIGKDVAARSAGQRIGAGAAGQAVMPAIAEDRIVATASVDLIGCIVADDVVRAAASFRVFDDGATRDGQVAHVAVDIGKALGIEIDPLVGAARRQVDCIVAIAVKDRDATARGQVHAELRQVGVVAIDRVACLCVGRRAVQVLDRDDIRDLRCREKHARGVDVRILVLVEIGHDRHLPAVIGKMRVIAESGAAVVIAAMAKAQRMADLVNIGLQVIVAIALPGVVDIDIGTDDRVAGCHRRRIGSGLVIIEGHHRRRGLHEVQTAHRCPSLKRLQCGCLAQRVEPVDVHRDRAAGLNVERSLSAALVLPETAGQVLRRLIDRIGWQTGGETGAAIAGLHVIQALDAVVVINGVGRIE